MHWSYLFFYTIIWFNIKIKFMINKDLLIVVGGIVGKSNTSLNAKERF